MKSLFALLLALCTPLLAQAAGPIRVLYLGQEGPPATHHCALLMQELGRDAIWFDYTTENAGLALGKFDVLVLDAPNERFPGLAEPNLPPLVKLTFAGDEKAWAQPEVLKAMRESILAVLPPARRQEWERFVAQREPEMREPNASVANYEKRPQPVTFQHPFSVKGSMERTQVPVDMHLELFAAEPQIMKPIAMAWDERGRLWVAETSDYPHGIVKGGEGHDDIKICEDTDGDGKADKFTVFADKLNLPTSLTFARGGLIVSQPPNFLFLKDTDGDDKADVREVLLQGWGIADTHAQASSLHYGLDNWIYGCVGYSGFKGTVGGQAQDFRMGTYRFRADGSQMEFLHQFSNNSWGQSANAAGDQFGGTANNAPLFYGGLPANLIPASVRIPSARKINVEDKAHAITNNYRQVDVFGGYTAAAGSAFVYSPNLPSRLQGKVLVCEPTMKLISLMDVQPQGAGYLAKDAFNLVASSDEWMSPVFAEVGPDGAVWFADFENFIIQHNPTPSVERGGYNAKTGVGGAHENPLRDHARGRIYRVVWDQAKPAPLSLQKAGTAELIQQLGSEIQQVRLTAQRLLVDGKKTDAVPALQKLALHAEAPVAASHALWALQGLGQLDAAALKAALAAKDPIVRRNAVRALGSDAASQTLLFSSAVLVDADPTTRLAALAKLAELPTSPEIQGFVRGLAKDAQVQGDEWLRDAARLLRSKHGGEGAGVLGPNLLPNAGFELTNGTQPQGWQPHTYAGEATLALSTEPGVAHAGRGALALSSTKGADASFLIDVPVEPKTDYQLSGWIKTKGVQGALGALLNVHTTDTKTDAISGDKGWTEVKVAFNSGERKQITINALFGGYGKATGQAWFDDLRLSAVGAASAEEEKLLTGDVQRGEQIVFKHAAVSCILCHMVKGQGSTVGPALDGIATRQNAQYISESLLEPNKVLAKGYEALGASPMPPMGLILKPQELEDLKAYLQTLK